MSNITIRTLYGKQIADIIPRLAQLRIAIFREYPYLYEGDTDYETDYLKEYATHQSSMCVTVFDRDQLVGASTAMELNNAAPEFQQCFIEKRISMGSVCYFGESLLLPNYRGQGIGRSFFEYREAHARQLHLTMAAFCAVERTENHPQKPKNYRNLHHFWETQGFRCHPDMCAFFNWRELGDSTETSHKLSFWLKSLS